MQLSRKLALATGGLTLVGLALGLPVKAEKTMVEDVTEVTETADMPTIEAPDLGEAATDLQDQVIETVAPQPAGVEGVDDVIEPGAEAEGLSPEEEVTDLEIVDEVETEAGVDVETEIEEEAVISPGEVDPDVAPELESSGEPAEEISGEPVEELEADVDPTETTEATDIVEDGKLEIESQIETPAIEAEITPIPGS